MRPNDHMRVQKEIKNILKDTASGVTVELRNESSIKYMIGSLLGPKDTPYEGGIFYVDIELDEQYPFAPPKMKFSTLVSHAQWAKREGYCASHVSVTPGWILTTLTALHVVLTCSH